MGWRWPALWMIVALLLGGWVPPSWGEGLRLASTHADSAESNNLVPNTPPAEGKTVLDSLLQWTDRLIDIVPDTGDPSGGECEIGMQRCCCGGECYCKKECSLKRCR